LRDAVDNEEEISRRKESGRRRIDRAARGRPYTAGSRSRSARSSRERGSAARTATTAGAVSLLWDRGRSSRRAPYSRNAPTADCPARAWQLLKHFVSRGAMDVEGLGEKQVALLQERGLVKTAGDFYRLSGQQLIRARGLRRAFGAEPARGDRLLEAATVCAGAVRAGDRGVWRGHRPANLAQRFRDIDSLLGASAEEIAQTPGGSAEKDGELDPRAAVTTSACAR